MWMLVDSSGSTKPPASPNATTFLFQALLAPARLDADQPGILDGPAAGIRDQAVARLVIRHVPAAEHHAIADAMLHGNVPAPAGGVRVTRGIGLRGFIDDGLERHRAVAGQPVRPVFVAGLQRAFDEQPAKARAVDEEIAGDHLAVLELERFDEAVVGFVRDLLDLAFDALHAPGLGRACAGIARTARRRSDRRS